MTTASEDARRDMNWADYCDELRQEHWSRLLKAAREEKRALRLGALPVVTPPRRETLGAPEGSPEA